MKVSASIVFLCAFAITADAFQIASTPTVTSFGVNTKHPFNLKEKITNFNYINALKQSSSEEDEMVSSSGIMELVDEDDEKKTIAVPATPFLSQGGISEEALNPDLSDPKQARVIIYIILSLIPVLFLIPLILGSRDFIPMDALPPVEM